MFPRRTQCLAGDSFAACFIRLTRPAACSTAHDSPAGRYLIEKGVKPADFNSYGARRGNHEVMMRGTFANVRLRNQMAPGTEGGWTRYHRYGGVHAARDRERPGAARGHRVVAKGDDGSTREFTATLRIDTPEELVAFRHGGILPYVVRQLVGRQ